MQILNGMASAAIFANCWVIWRTLTVNAPDKEFDELCGYAFATLVLNTVILAGYMLAPYL